ncbi:MAG: hypothetical protein J0L66_11655 [Cytophagales bacterium]|nr:hypothetical protein [Cytophagales bacterium]
MIQKKELWEAIQSREFKTQREFSEFRRMFIEAKRQESKSKTCYDEVSKMREDAELAFLDQNDRTTWRNSYNAHISKLIRNMDEETQGIRDEARAIESKIYAMQEKLPWRE